MRTLPINRAIAAGVGAAGLLILLQLAVPAPAHAVGVPKVPNPLDLPEKVGGVIKDITLGGLDIGVRELAKLVLGIIGVIADLIVPDWVGKLGGRMLIWFADTPDWAAQGGATYPSINELHDVLTWVGVGLLGTGSIWAGSSVLIGSRSPEEVIRTLVGAAAALVLYKWGWSQAAAVTNSITELMIDVRSVQRGFASMMGFVAGGSLVGVGNVFGPLLVIAAAVAFLGLLLAKAAIILLSAVVYVSGGLVFGMVLFPWGRALVSAWGAMAVASFAIPIVWMLIFAVAGVLVSDAMKAGTTAIETKGAISGVLNQLMLGAASLVAFYLAIKSAGTIFGLARTMISPAFAAVGVPTVGASTPDQGLPFEGALRRRASALSPGNVRQELGRLSETMAAFGGGPVAGAMGGSAASAGASTAGGAAGGGPRGGASGGLDRSTRRGNDGNGTPPGGAGPKPLTPSGSASAAAAGPSVAEGAERMRTSTGGTAGFQSSGPASGHGPSVPTAPPPGHSAAAPTAPPPGQGPTAPSAPPPVDAPSPPAPPPRGAHTAPPDRPQTKGGPGR